MMMRENILLNSLKGSFTVIWRSKALVFLLFVLQIIFFGSFFYLGNYQVKIIEDAINMSNYLSEQNFDDVTIANSILEQKDILGDNPELIGQKFDSITRNFRIYMIYTFALMAVFLSAVWALAKSVVDKSYGKLNGLFLKNISVSVFCFGLMAVFLSLLLNIPFSEAAFDISKLLKKYMFFALFSAALLYFGFISYSLDYMGIGNLIQKTLNLGIKKFYYFIAVYFIIIFAIFLLMNGIIYFVDSNFFIATLFLLLLVFSFVFWRILMINVVERLEKSI